ncbi:cytochrome b5 reductase 1, isoform CRA_d [Homo sapiens]|nr:cytochrome b5 reductase 1, isoform CRA_d [Homo sapiens]
MGIQTSPVLLASLGVGLVTLLGLAVGSYLVRRSRRPQVTLLDPNEKYLLRLLDKTVYLKGVHPKFPEGGKMSQYLDSLKVGDVVEFRGPSGLLTYTGKGHFNIQPNKKSPPEPRVAKKLGMIAGGTGITPMLQLIRAILKVPEDPTQCFLLFANQTEKDIILREDLEELQARYPNRFKLWFTLDHPPKDWAYSKGFVTADMIREHLPAPGDDVLVLLCGPPPMVQLACHPNLDKLGYSQKMRFTY